jgi:hypothetical protein
MAGAAQGLATTEDGKYSSASVTLAEDLTADDGAVILTAGNNVTINIPVPVAPDQDQQG